MPPQNSGFSLVRPATVLVALTLAAWLLVVLQPRIMTLFGMEYPERWFLDSYAVLASGDAVRAGISPDAPNPLDPMQRSHKYSDWWLVLGRMGLTRSDNFLFGGSWVVGFLAFAVWVLRVKSYREAGIALLFLASPPVLLAVNRANNDLVVFILLAVAGLCLIRDTNWRVAGAGAAVALATGLKFYPAVALLFVLLVRPGRRLLFSLGLLAAGLGLVIWDVWPTISRGFFPIYIDINKVGAPIFLTDIGLEGRVPQMIAAMLVALAGWWLAVKKYTAGLASPATGFHERACFVLGASVLLACFVAGISFDYRLVFFLLLLPWLRRVTRLADGSPVSPAVIRLTYALMFVMIWADGLFCLILNLWWTPQPEPAVTHVLKVWRLATQPLHWLLACFLAGWLWDLVLEAWRAIRADRGARAA